MGVSGPKMPKNSAIKAPKLTKGLGYRMIWMPRPGRSRPVSVPLGPMMRPGITGSPVFYASVLLDEGFGPRRVRDVGPWKSVVQLGGSLKASVTSFWAKIGHE